MSLHFFPHHSQTIEWNVQIWKHAVRGAAGSRENLRSVRNMLKEAKQSVSDAVKTAVGKFIDIITLRQFDVRKHSNITYIAGFLARKVS